MLFKGTRNRTSKQIASEIDNLGGQINAFTSKECTCYYVKLLDSHIDIGIDVLSDMILNSNEIAGKEIVNLVTGERLGVVGECDLILDEALLIPRERGFWN